MRKAMESMETKDWKNLEKMTTDMFQGMDPKETISRIKTQIAQMKEKIKKE